MGRHSADFGDFGTTADLKSSSAPKSPKNYESPTAIPRILEEESQASKSLRDLREQVSQSIKVDSKKTPFHRHREPRKVAWRSTKYPTQQAKLESSNNAQKVDSSMDCHADFQSAHNDIKLDSSALAHNDSKSTKPRIYL